MTVSTIYPLHVVKPKRGGNHATLGNNKDTVEKFFVKSREFDPSDQFDKESYKKFVKIFDEFEETHMLNEVKFKFRSTDDYMSVEMPVVLVNDKNEMKLSHLTLQSDNARAAILGTNAENGQLLNHLFTGVSAGNEYAVYMARLQNLQCLIAFSSEHPRLLEVVNAARISRVPRQQGAKVLAIARTSYKPWPLKSGRINYSKTRIPIGAARYYLFFRGTSLMEKQYVHRMLIIGQDNSNANRKTVAKKPTKRSEENCTDNRTDNCTDQYVDQCNPRPLYAGKALKRPMEGGKHVVLRNDPTYDFSDIRSNITNNVVFSPHARAYFLNFVNGVEATYIVDPTVEMDVMFALDETVNDSVSDEDMFSRLAEIEAMVQL